MANKTCFVFRDGKIVEIPKSEIDRSTNVQSTGEYHDWMHSVYDLDDVRSQHMTDSNRAENAHNKERGI